MTSSEPHYLQITEADYEGDQFLTLGRAEFGSEAECIAAYDKVLSVEEDTSAQREYKLDRFAGLARVDEKFIAGSTVVELLGADLVRIHNQAVAVLDSLLVPTGVTVLNPHAIGDPDATPALRINPGVADLFHQARRDNPPDPELVSESEATGDMGHGT